MFKPKHKNIILAMHRVPDADCVASLQIVKRILQEQNEDLKFYIVTDTPFKVPFPEYLQPTDPVIQNSEIPKGSAAYIVDHSDQEYSLLKDWGHPNIKELYIIDHHYDSSENLTKAKKLIDTNARSCCEVLYDYILANNLMMISKDIATMIYIGIFTDSLSFQTPLNETLILKLADLIKKYGAEVDKHHLYYRGRFFLYKKRMAEVLFLHTEKLKTSNTVSVKLDCALLERLRNNWIGVRHIMAEVLNTRGVNHVLIRFEPFPGIWTLCIASNVFKAIEGFVAKPQKPLQHYYSSLTAEQCKNLSKVMRGRLKDYDANLGKFDWYEVVTGVDPEKIN